MPEFNVGDGVRTAMTMRGDEPVASSHFEHPFPGLTKEIGFGRDRGYIWDDFAGEPRLVLVEYDESPPMGAITDVRGLLPIRSGAVPYPMRPLSDLQLFVVHHTAGPAISTVQSIARYQTGSDAHLPFPAIAYHYFVERDGTVYRCHDLARRTWGSDGSYGGRRVNDIAIHACYAGNDDVAPAQIAGLRAARTDVDRELGRSLTVRGHGEDDATACPGSSWPRWKSQII